MTSPDPRREQYAGAITEHLWGSPEDIDEATSSVMELADQERQKAVARVRAARERIAHAPGWVDAIWCLDVLDEALGITKPVPAPAATEATDTATTTRVFAALHHSAEQDVTRVIGLYERWVKAGPPPLGTSLARWWDARLVELHDAIRPPADGTREQP